MITRLLLVAAGGALGTAARLGIDLVLPAPGGFPLATLLVNVGGAFLIGIVMVRIERATGIRLFLTTGVLGGFTTYSAFGVGATLLWESAPALAAGYTALSLALGVAAAAAGMGLARPRRRTT